jgi:ABC-type branched-subunit amino acid transport system ATPase component
MKAAKSAIVGLIGPNGSGKTTFIDIVTGFCKPTEGNLFFNERRIDRFSSHQISKLGIGRTFQETRVFKKMTVLENLLVAAQQGTSQKVTAEAIDLLRFFEIYDLRNEYAENLSYGQQKLLELARVLMIQPQLILLDEPTSGIHPAIIEKMLDCFRRLHDQGKTLIIVEHNIPVVCAVCETIVVLDHGVKIAEGPPEDIQKNAIVQEAYLGGNQAF